MPTPTAAYRPPVADRETYRALETYDGDNAFLRTLAARARAGYGLTARQLAAARRCFREATPTPKAEAPAPTRYPIPPVPREGGPRGPRH